MQQAAQHPQPNSNNSEEPPSRQGPATAPPTPEDVDSPLVSAVRWLRDMVRGRNETSLKEAIEDMLEDETSEQWAMTTEEKNLLTNMVTFGELTVDDIMVPRSDIAAIARTSSLETINKTAIETGHTRIPVYGESLDKIDGFVHVKDLLPYLSSNNDDVPLDTLIRNILFVPPSMRGLDLLMKMRVSGCHMAIVVDEYGGTDGLVTMEDLFEELVGEINDEHDQEEQEMMVWASDNVLEADARTPIALLEETFGERVSEGDVEELDYDTLGGYVFFTLGRVPAKGEVLHLRAHIKMEIMAADPRRIYRVRLTRLAVK